MCSDEVVLSVRNISKCFEMYERPVHRLYQTLCAGKKKFYREFWALRDVSFDVHRGEFLGIIGRNGAGKSTILQIITGTLAPTSGLVETHGRIAALLELGSGFNPEFTGRENVYLNGTLLGLTTAEISARYQEILDFADIGDFINQPIKTYSSGMMVRLAFAVQVMVEPDILIVDEALAVGDAAFQRKCNARMDHLRERGTTIILVTHDTETVKQRCDRVVFLKDHTVAFDGDAEEGVVEYMRYLFPQEAAAMSVESESGLSETCRPRFSPDEGFIYCKEDLQKDPNTWGIGGALIRAIRIFGLKAPNFLCTPGKVKIEIDAQWNADFVRAKIAEESLFPGMMVGIRLADVKNLPIYGTNNVIERKKIDPSTGFCTAVFELDLPQLRSGDYFLTAAISVGSMNAHVHLVWDDLSIQLRNESSNISDGVVYCPTKVEIRQ